MSEDAEVYSFEKAKLNKVKQQFADKISTVLTGETGNYDHLLEGHLEEVKQTTKPKEKDGRR